MQSQYILVINKGVHILPSDHLMTRHPQSRCMQIPHKLTAKLLKYIKPKLIPLVLKLICLYQLNAEHVALAIEYYKMLDCVRSQKHKIIVSLYLALKVNHDCVIKSKAWAKECGISNIKLNELEMILLKLLDFNVYLR
eukprot:NODE_619_length_5349_cov_0.609524.p4 type:complete len:138 gc:universal NODE_619_length_5349_cov_0.609524:3254-3667(+)